METTVLMIAMLLSFALGAYLRNPFPLFRRTITDGKGANLGPIIQNPLTKEDVDKYMEGLLEHDKHISERRRGELMNAWNYNGTPQKEVDGRD